MTLVPDTHGVDTFLLDIEGTTTPIDFVHRTLFPYARAHAGSYLRTRLGSPELREEADRFRREHTAEREAGESPPAWRGGSDEEKLASTLAYVTWLMDRDRKSTALKSLQGRIWEAGYREGTLRGQVYPEVPGALRRWREQGKTVAIFSSGSVLAQRLLFTHTGSGDLGGLIDAYFDTTTGPKKEAASYMAIAHILGREPDAVLFVSDVAVELDAAREAGMRTALCVRGGEAPPTDHPFIRTLDGLLT